MISQCSNPQCGKPFHYLRGGKLYRFDVRRPVEPCRDIPNAICASKPSQASVFFWLCGECASRSSLRFSLREGISLVPLQQLPEGSNPVVTRAVAAE